MQFPTLAAWSLKQKITLFTLLIVLVSLWTLTFVVSYLLRNEMATQMGEQQFDTVAIMAQDLGDDMKGVRSDLEKVAAQIGPELMRKPEALQDFLVGREHALDNFNAGFFVANPEGIAIASLPVERKRVGSSFMDRDFISLALQDNKTTIGQPVRGKLLPNPIIGMATPIHDKQGRVIGVLAGVLNLAQPSFLDHFTEHKYGKTGGHFIVEKSTRMIVGASDVSRIMTVIPEQGKDSLAARFNRGFEGFGVHVNTLGVEVLSSSSNILSTDWRLVAALPTEEAFAPVRSLQTNMQLIALGLSLLVSLLTWLMLRHHLKPLTSATLALTDMTEQGNVFQALPIERHDEVGVLIGSFNQLLGEVEIKSAELTKERQRLSNIIDGTSAGTWEMDLQTGQTHINERWAEMLGYSAAELNPICQAARRRESDSRMTWEDHVHPDDLPQAEAMLKSYLRGETSVFNSTYRMRHKNGHWVWVQSRAKITQRLANGKPWLVAGANLDISNEKNFEASLIAAKEQAEQATVAKSQFLSNMSHEIRTPMHAILGMLQLMHNTELTTRQLDYIDKTQTAAQSLLGLINDILDISKMEANKLSLDPQPFHFNALMRDLSVIFGSGTSDKPVEVLFDIASDVPRVMVGDAMRLKQILVNLGGNAIKFTPQGTVVLKVRVTSQSAAGTTLNFAFIDSGIGIDPQVQQHIFEGFAQAETSTTRRYGGTGLGLSICTQLVRLMGGTLQVDSALGKGSTFYFSITLPVGDERDVELIAPPHPAPTPTGPLHVLLVDNCPQAREIMAAMVQSWGWTCDQANDGAEAVGLVQARHQKAQAPYQLVLVDWQMSGMDGWETLAQVQALYPAAEAPICIMVTAHDRDMLKQRSAYEKTVPIDGYIVKPFTASMLYDEVIQIQSVRRNGQAAKAPVGMGQSLAGLRVLLVEDNLINQQVAQELLVSEGALVDVADNGQLALDALGKAQPMYDVVLMDVQMPVMDGFTATSKIRQELGLVYLPIIAMTANAMESDRDKCLAAGMNAHLGKPFDFQQLVTLLQSHCPRPQGAATAADAAADLAADVLDTDQAIKRLGGNSALYGRILNAYDKEIGAAPDQLHDLLQQQDFAQASRLMHALKGVSGTVGANYLFELSQTMEAQLLHPVAGTDCDALEAKLREAVLATQAAVRSASARYAPPASAAPTAARSLASLDVPAVLSVVNELHGLLSSSDMRALQVHTQLLGLLPTQPDPVLNEGVQQLGQAMANFDFAQGAAECTRLMQYLAASTST